MIKYLGLSLILLAALGAAREYSLHQKRRAAEFEELLRFVREMRRGIACFLAPLSELASSFASEPLSAIGFTSALRAGRTPSEALAAAAPRSALASPDLHAFRELFASLGASYRCDELELIDSHIAKLGVLLEALRSELPRKTRAAAILLTSSAVGAAFLML